MEVLVGVPSVEFYRSRTRKDPRGEEVRFILFLFYFIFLSLLISSNRAEYEVYKNQWKSITAEQKRRFKKYRTVKNRIKKDVIRTDRSVEYFAGDGEKNPNLRVLYDVLLTYSFFNFDIGYVQGMNDLLSPI